MDDIAWYYIKLPGTIASQSQEPATGKLARFPITPFADYERLFSNFRKAACQSKYFVGFCLGLWPNNGL